MNNRRDQALIERCREGDRRALEELVRAYEKPVYNAAFRILGNPDDAADAMQTAFLKAFENLHRYNPKYKFFSWIYRIALNEAINLTKRNKHHSSLEESETAGRDNPEKEVQASDLSREIQAGLMKLNENYRTVVILRHFTECSYRQISEILEIPEKTVKSRLYSARQLMKEQMEAGDVL